MVTASVRYLRSYSTVLHTSSSLQYHSYHSYRLWKLSCTSYCHSTSVFNTYKSFMRWHRSTRSYCKYCTSPVTGNRSPIPFRNPCQVICCLCPLLIPVAFIGTAVASYSVLPAADSGHDSIPGLHAEDLSQNMPYVILLDRV